jgi:hypothetical protein
MKNKENNCPSNKCSICSPAPNGVRHQDELADWPSVMMWLRLVVVIYGGHHVPAMELRESLNKAWLDRQPVSTGWCACLLEVQFRFLEGNQTIRAQSNRTQIIFSFCLEYGEAEGRKKSTYLSNCQKSSSYSPPRPCIRYLGDGK